MNKKILLCIAAFFASSMSFAESPAVPVEGSQLKSIGNVRVSMQRMLRSTDGRYFLDLYAGIWNPHGVLTDTAENKSIAFKGSQKGDFIHLKSVSVDSMDEAVAKYELSGKLDANTGLMAAELSSFDPKEHTAISFEPAFKAADKPVIIFKF